MKLAAILCVAFTIAGCSHIPHRELLGHWKSDEKKTLESFHSVKGVTVEAKELFEKDFFGKLLVEYKVDTYRAKYEDDEDNIEEFYQYYPYKVIESGSNYYLVESQSLLYGEVERKKIHMEGDCYYVYVSKWNFKEYFCKYKQ